MTTTVDHEHMKSRYTKRTTQDTSVREILETFSPPDDAQTGVHLVSFGPQHYFLVIQGPEAELLTNRVLEYLDSLHQSGEDAK